MMEDTDFIEGDMFDPNLAVQAEDATYDAATEVNAEVAEFIRKRKVAYEAVFTGKAEPGDVQFVMLDLAHFCRAYRPTFHPTNQKIQDLQEGRREVYQRIMDYTLLDHDTLMKLYTKTEAERGMKR